MGVKTWLINLQLVVFLLGGIAFAGPKERAVTETLLEEGYTLEQSSPAKLLEMMHSGYSWDRMDPWMAYHNFERFYPFSQELKLQALDSALKATQDPNSKMDVSRIVMALVGEKSESLTVIQKLRLLMQQTKDWEAKRMIARHLIAFPHTEADAKAALLEVFQKSPSGTVKILSALDLMRNQVQFLEAERFLIQETKNAEVLKSLLFYGSGSGYGDVLTQRLVEAMEVAARGLSGADARMAEVRLTSIRQKVQDVAERAPDSRTCQGGVPKAFKPYLVRN